MPGPRTRGSSPPSAQEPLERGQLPPGARRTRTCGLLWPCSWFLSSLGRVRSGARRVMDLAGTRAIGGVANEVGAAEVVEVVERGVNPYAVAGAVDELLGVHGDDGPGAQLAHGAQAATVGGAEAVHHRAAGR